MALAIDVIDRLGPSYKMCRHLQPKKTKVKLLLSVYITAKDAYLPFTNKTEHFSFKSGYVLRVENDEMGCQ